MRIPCAPLLCGAGGGARSGPLDLNEQLNQRLVQGRNQRLEQGRSARELLRLHAEHGRSFNDVNLATCWSRLGRAGCGEGFNRQMKAL